MYIPRIVAISTNWGIIRLQKEGKFRRTIYLQYVYKVWVNRVLPHSCWSISSTYIYILNPTTVHSNKYPKNWVQCFSCALGLNDFFLSFASHFRRGKWLITKHQAHIINYILHSIPCFDQIMSRKSTPHKDEELNLLACSSYVFCSSFNIISEIRLTTWDLWNPVNNGINYQLYQVIAGFNHQRSRQVAATR